jgi:hypothetical protein
MSKNSAYARIKCFNLWLEDLKKKTKYGKPKRVIVDDDTDIDFKYKKKKGHLCAYKTLPIVKCQTYFLKD